MLVPHWTRLCLYILLPGQNLGTARLVYAATQASRGQNLSGWLSEFEKRSLK